MLGDPAPSQLKSPSKYAPTIMIVMFLDQMMREH